MVQEHDAPYFRGWLVRVITADDDGLALWLSSESRVGLSRMTVADGVAELKRLAAGAAHDELKDALAVCHQWQARSRG